MLSDEEKKAIEIVKGLAVYYDDYGLLDEEEIEENEEVNNSINIVINLIEKQSKEIEDNKKYIDLHYVPYEQYVSKLNELNKKWKDKIKAKIEEYEKEIQIRKNVINNDVLDKQTIEKARIEWACMEDFIYEMQSLLEKE